MLKKDIVTLGRQTLGSGMISHCENAVLKLWRGLHVASRVIVIVYVDG